MFKKKKVCDVPQCDTKLGDEPVQIVIDGAEFDVCDDCGRVMELIQQKFEERLSDDAGLNYE